MDLNTLGNTLGFICILLYALFFCLPAFMNVMMDDIFGLGCFGIVCLFVGFPGTLIALIVKIIIGIKEQKEESERLQNKYEEGKRELGDGNYSRAKFIFEELKDYRDSAALAHKAEQLHNAKEAANEKKRQEHYNKLRTAIYPNSERMMELLGIINSSVLPPHTIEIEYDAVTIYFEDKTKTYNFLSRDFGPLYLKDEQEAFADALCSKLNGRYTKSEITKVHESKYSDGESYYWTQSLGFKLIRKATRQD